MARCQFGQARLHQIAVDTVLAHDLVLGGTASAGGATGRRVRRAGAGLLTSVLAVVCVHFRLRSVEGELQVDGAAD